MVELDFCLERLEAPRHYEVVKLEKVYKALNDPTHMNKWRFNPRKLEDKLAIDGLCAVSVLDRKPISKGLYYLVGGFAAQSYLPSKYCRETADIDLAVVRPLNHEEFKEFSGSALEYLRDQGYVAETRKGQGAYQIVFSKGDDAAVIEFARRNDQNFKKRESILRRELANTRVKTIPGRDHTYRVASPEDIAMPKVVRSVGSLDRNDDFVGYLDEELTSMSEGEIITRLNRIGELREEAMMHLSNPYIAEKLRFISDIYDVRILSQVSGFNENYLNRVIEDWEVLKNPSQNRDLLFKCLLPKLFEVER